MNTYYLRCRQSRYPTLVDRGVRMGAIRQENGVISSVGPGAWDYVGKKTLEDGTLAGGAKDPFIHVNFRTEADLKKLAMIAAQTDLDIAAGLGEIASYFIVDAEGKATAPAFPMRVFL